MAAAPVGSREPGAGDVVSPLGGAGSEALSYWSGAGYPAFPPDRAGRLPLLGGRSRGRRCGGAGSGVSYGQFAQRFDLLGQGRISSLSGVNRIVSPKFQGPVHVHVWSSHAQGVAWVVEGDVGQLPEVDHVL